MEINLIITAAILLIIVVTSFTILGFKYGKRVGINAGIDIGIDVGIKYAVKRFNGVINRKISAKEITNV